MRVIERPRAVAGTVAASRFLADEGTRTAPGIAVTSRTVLRLGVWRVVGTLPDVPRLVLIAAPHSSNWDGIWGMAAKMALGFDARVLGKASLFWWPLGPLLRALGVVPVDRTRRVGEADATHDHGRPRGLEVLPFPSSRRAVTAAVRAGHRIVLMHGLPGIDVTEAR